MDHKIKVLIADRNVDFTKSVKDYLDKQDNITVVSVAHDGQSVLQNIHSAKPDVVTLDAMFSHADAIGILSELRSLAPEERPRVIMVTAFASDNFLSACMQGGADYCLLKPVDVRVLKERIELVAKLGRTPRVNITNPVSSDEPAKLHHHIEVEATNMLHSLGVPANIKGYQYLRKAISLCVFSPDLINAVTKQLYPGVAAKFDTTPSRVERAIRHAIETACVRGNDEQFFNLFGYTMNNSRCKPTNSEFIAMISDKLRLEFAADLSK